MTAPSTPNLGPQGYPSRRGGSVSGGPWQLVEVTSKEAAVARSQPGTPLITAQKSPVITAQKSPAAPPSQSPHEELEDWNIGDPLVALEEEGPGSVTERRERQNSLRPPQHIVKGAEGWEEEDGFNPQCFIGEWTDNLGHYLSVTLNESGGRQRERRRRNRNGDRGDARVSFLAVLQKFGMPDKRFNINRPRARDEWTCGNGVLVREESSTQKIVWKSDDGRVSTWERLPPDGPVYFDLPPGAAGHEEESHDWYQSSAGAHASGPVVFFSPEAIDGPPQGEWKGLHLPADDEGGNVESAAANAAIGERAPEERPAPQWNLEAPEFVPASFAAPAAPASSVPSNTVSPALRAAPSPLISPAVPPGPLAAQAAACQLELSEASPDVQITGHRLEWVLPDDWGKLSRFPKDFCLTSPMFGVQQAANMQLVFYPNGSRTAEAGRCTVALTRGPDSAGIKFEFSVNGRGSGPKVCLGRRYLGDYPKPYDDSEENKVQKVAVCMQVLEVLGI